MFRLASAVLLWLACTQSWAERSLLSGSLGLWLTDTAAVELVDVLGNHPKFKGQRIRIVTLQDGKPAQHSNRLNDAIQQQLTHRILRAGRNDVAWQSDRPNCARVSNEAPYLVGIEVTRSGRHKHRVNVAILDTEEAVWVSGVSLTWSGKLLDVESRALAEPISRATSGTLLNPIPVDQRKRLIEVILSQIQCALPSGLDGTVHMQAATEPQLQMVMREFAQGLSLRPGLTTTDSTQAQWQMHAAMSAASFDTQELTISLAPHDSPAATQRIAAVFVTGAVIDNPAPLLTPVTHEPPVFNRRPQQVHQLLGQLRRFDDGKRCHADGEPCVEVAFNLQDKAHLLVFRTNNATALPTSCVANNARRDRGEHRYRVKLPPLQRDEHAGIYVVASRQRNVIRKLTRQIQRGPGACGSLSRRPHSQWLTEVIEFVEKNEDALEWRALHLVRTDTGLETI